MLNNFSIKNTGLFIITLLLCAIFSVDSFGQSCPTCPATGSGLSIKEYSGAANVGNNNWSPSGEPGVTNIARFPEAGTFNWDAGGNNEINIAGLVLETNVTLNIGRSNNNETPAFNISGGCIVIKNGATLNFTYFTKLDNLNICVEPGGKIVFSSDAAGGSTGQRDDFSFGNVIINLIDDTSKIEFGNADIVLPGSGLIIEGWTGGAEDFCREGYTPPIPGNSGNISWTSQFEIDQLCKILDGRVLPVEYLSFTANYNDSKRSNKIKWVTASEKNNSHFIIQRSINAINSWEDIGEVNGAINSDLPTEYNFIDTYLPLSGGNIYYRLKQVDLEGKSSLGEVVSVRVGAMSGKGTWRVYPNPNNGESIKLELLNKEKYKGEEISIRLLSNYNSLDNRQFVTKDIFDLSNQLQQMLSPIGNGVAVLEIIWGNQVEHIKILKK